MTVYTGPRYRPDAPICVIVMAVKAPRHAACAVRSITAQSVPTEIVVVNSGRGSLAGILGAELGHVRLVEQPERLLPGGARNLGIQQSRAPIVAFLAADCGAPPDWCERRLGAHRAGHATVASALIPAPNRQGRVTASARAGNWITHRNRIPGTPAERAGRFGLSYERRLFEELGLFRDDLLVGEDSEFNRKAAHRCGTPLWDSNIVTMHRYPFTAVAAAWDQFHRARRTLGYQVRHQSRDIGTLAGRVVRDRANALNLIPALCRNQLTATEYHGAYRIMKRLFYARLIGALSLWCRVPRH